MTETDLHDAEVFAVEHLRSQAALTFKVRAESGFLLAVHCTGVVGFALDPFEEQNIIFAFRSYNASSIPVHLREDLLPQHRDALSAGALYLQLDPSVGMGGWIVAQAVSVEALLQGPALPEA